MSQPRPPHVKKRIRAAAFAVGPVAGLKHIINSEAQPGVPCALKGFLVLSSWISDPPGDGAVHQGKVIECRLRDLTEALAGEGSGCHESAAWVSFKTPDHKAGLLKHQAGPWREAGQRSGHIL